MEKKSTTFKSLQVLKDAQESTKAELGDKYEEMVTPFVKILSMVMKANGINEFEAMLKIKNNTELYNKPDAPVFFACAVMEITEVKHFEKFTS